MKQYVLAFLAFTLLTLGVIGCTYYMHSFQLPSEESLRVDKHSIDILVWAFGPGSENKHAENRRFNVILSVETVERTLSSEAAEIEFIDKLYHIDSFIVAFGRDDKPHVVRLDHTNAFEDRTYKSYWSEGFVIPDSISSISVTVPYYSVVDGGETL